MELISLILESGQFGHDEDREDPALDDVQPPPLCARPVRARAVRGLALCWELQHLQVPQLPPGPGRGPGGERHQLHRGVQQELDL